MGIQCPLAPEQDTMRMLIRANQFLMHAKSHSFSGREFDTMIAIHNLDNAIEYVLRILISHFDVENLTGKTINTCELSVLIGELSKFFKDNSLPALPYEQQLKVIREQRNLVQHAMVNPSSDVKVSIQHGEKFFERVLDRYFGIKVTDLTFSSLVKDSFVKERLKSAEDKIKSMAYVEAVVECRDAFDYAKFNYSYMHQRNVWSVPGLLEAKRHFYDLEEMLKTMNETIVLSSSGVDMPKYYQYLEYIDCIPREFRKDHRGHRVLQREWTKTDADYCYWFVSDTVLAWQSNEVHRVNEPIHIPVPMEITRIIAGVKIEENFLHKNCTYALSDKMVELFYISAKNDVDRLFENIKNTYVWYETKKDINHIMKRHSRQLVKVLDGDYRLVMNNPETWEVYIAFDYVPFTEQIMDGETVDQKIVNIDEKGAPDNISDFEMIRTYLPLSTYEEAVSLKTKMEEQDIRSDGFYSSKLIESLLANCSQLSPSQLP